MHNLDITNGVVSFATAREDAWHSLGTTFPQAMTAEEALREAHLAGWNVRKMPMLVRMESGLEVPLHNRFAVVRDNPVAVGQTDVLGDVGTAYRVWQNEELVGLLESLVDESGAHFETAGAIQGGRRVFVTMKMPGHIRVGGVDPVENYLAVVTSHDGSLSHTLMVTPVRIVCQNTLNVAFGQNHSMFKIKHTRGSAEIMLNQARQALDLSFDFLDGFQEQAERMIDTTLTQAQFEQIIEREFGAPEDAAPSTQTRTNRKLDELAALFADSHTHADVRGTMWAGFNALTEWADHFAPTRGDTRDLDRSLNAIFRPTLKQKALELFSVA